MESWIQMINSVGFPIFAFLLMFWQSTSVIKENTKALKELAHNLKRSQ